MRIFIILVFIVVSGCGMFKKNKTVSRLHDNSEVNYSENSIYSKVDTSIIEKKKFIEITFKIGKNKIGRITDLEPLASRNMFTDLIDRSEEVKVTVDAKTLKENKIFEREEIKEVKQERKDIEKKELKKEKETDARISTNLPWYYVVIIIIAILLILYIFTGVSIKSFTRFFSRK